MCKFTHSRSPAAGSFTQLIKHYLLGCILSDQNSIYSIVNLLSPDAFYLQQHSLIYETILTLFEKNAPIDILTVTSELRSRGNLSKVGDAYYVSQLTLNVASTANIEQYAAILAQKHIARKMATYGIEISNAAFDEQQDVFELIDKADFELSKINEISIRGGSMSHIKDASDKAIAELYTREKLAKEGRMPGIATGLNDLDRLTGGWQPNNLIILAARPAMGKTALMLHFALHAALSGSNVCIYTLEMSEISLVNRMLISMSNVNINNFKNGSMSQKDWQEIYLAKSRLDKLPIYLDPNPAVSMKYIKSNSRIMKRKGKCDIIFIDYLQLTDMNTKEKNRNREQEVAQASRQAKIIAKELNIPVVLLSQLSRRVEDRPTGRPALSDLRESGAIEQDADMVSFIYRPEYYGVEKDASGNSSKGVGELIIAKHREGATEDIYFKYNESMSKIYDFDLLLNELKYRKTSNTSPQPLSTRRGATSPVS